MWLHLTFLPQMTPSLQFSPWVPPLNPSQAAGGRLKLRQHYYLFKDSLEVCHHFPPPLVSLRHSQKEIIKERVSGRTLSGGCCLQPSVEVITAAPSAGAVCGRGHHCCELTQGLDGSHRSQSAPLVCWGPAHVYSWKFWPSEPQRLHAGVCAAATTTII